MLARLAFGTQVMVFLCVLYAESDVSRIPTCCIDHALSTLSFLFLHTDTITIHPRLSYLSIRPINISSGSLLSALHTVHSAQLSPHFTLHTSHAPVFHHVQASRPRLLPCRHRGHQSNAISAAATIFIKSLQSSPLRPLR